MWGGSFFWLGGNMLKVEHLSKTFHTDKGVVEAVKDVSFEVRDGEIFGLIGLSGAGKSTLVRCLNLLERPDKGRVLFEGEDMTAMNEKILNDKRKEIGMIFQHFNLFHQRTVYENIAFPLRRLGKSSSEIDARVKELLAYVDLSDKKDAYPSEISGGQKQRVAIARALATRPKLLLSDEGTSALDPRTTADILDLLKKSAKELGLTVVLITHQMEVAKKICDRIAVMEEGRIIEEGSVQDLFLRPKMRLTKELVERTVDEVEEYGDFGGKSYRLSFNDTSVGEPIISRLVREYHVDVNLRGGNMNALRTGNVGYLIVDLIGEPDEIDRALKHLDELGVIVEVI